MGRRARVGVATENKKLERFHDDPDAGKYLILIYALKEKEGAVLAHDGRTPPRGRVRRASTATSSTRSARSQRGASAELPGKRAHSGGHETNGRRDRALVLLGVRHVGVPLPESVVVHADRVELVA